MELNKIINKNCITGLMELPDACIDTCVTSPPYFGLRDYGTPDQIGLEETPDAFVSKMVEVFEQVRRVLKPTGTLWLNLGDSYAANRSYQVEGNISGKGTNEAQSVSGRGMKASDYGLKPKDLIGIPWMVAFALRSAGWYLRSDIIWYKRNPMPESVTDRPTKAHEYIFLLSKSQKYYYDHEAIMKPFEESSIQRLSQNIDAQAGSDRVPGKTNGNMKAVGKSRVFNANNTKGLSMTTGAGGNRNDAGRGNTEIKANGVNKRSVWDVPTKPFSDAHFATYPEDLIVDCIKAGCPEDGVVLDPFMGAGTTALVASKLNRNFIGFELNPEYIEIAKKRLQNELGMFNKLIA